MATHTFMDIMRNVMQTDVVLNGIVPEEAPWWFGLELQLHRTDFIITDRKLIAIQFHYEILGPMVLPFLEHNNPGITFLQDSIPAHSVHVIQDFFQGEQHHHLVMSSLLTWLVPIRACMEWTWEAHPSAASAAGKCARTAAATPVHMAKHPSKLYCTSD